MSNGIVERALSCLGKGFDLTSDFRLKYCKGDDRLVLLNETKKKTLLVPGFGPINDVPIDIRCDKGDRCRYQSDILEFNKMSEFFNQKSSVPGKVPSGLFNAMFGFPSNSWATDAANTKYLGLDGYFIGLFNLHIDRYPLVLSDEVRNAVPSSWDPSALARFIEQYGTHVIVGMTVGGHDIVLVRQDKSSNMAPTELKEHLDELGDQLFNGACTFSPLHCKSKESKLKTPRAFNVFDSQPLAFRDISTSGPKDVVKCSKRGGDLSCTSHCEWLLTVPSKPDAIHFSFIPITSLLKGAPGNGFLSHAINLYLRYKPPIEELQYFLDFQTHKLWAPVHNDLPLGPTTNRAAKLPSLSVTLMGPKLYVNTSMVVVGSTPVTGMRLYLEGMKCNRLGIHLQHLWNPPTMLDDKVDPTPIWQGSEEVSSSQYLEGIQGKKFSHICTAPVEFEPRGPSYAKDSAYIVTGAQLHVKKHDSKNVLHLRLRFSRVSSSSLVQSSWDRGAAEMSQKSGLLSAIGTSLTGNYNPEKNKKKEALINMDSSVFPTGPPMPVQTQKLLKYVDTSQRCRGPQDSPGHWLVTGAKLDLEKGKICVHVKFSLLNMCS
ncbi:hypothetical protein CDL15_Pgr010732 [Punica granatum]|uniref:MACPF domain-containing protein n=1 Tax=Punica granatum TaxID=22663 RepID=A0A218W4J2_PUNGR|nr:hypothetical protein CDL15_Pgr010732 [Punica granatum]